MKTFAPVFPIRSLDDKEVPMEQALTVRSTYEIFRNSAEGFGDKTALTFPHTGNPADEPIRWSCADLLAGIHQTASRACKPEE